ncbi:hypothetical protein M8818_006442 [Zalaria obscura]|uniref:Uncharacterized protein n=1 Tax=Zalaria obscura TaxID=2024903 RepID=A0ACC3S5Q7_9PEZI
MPVADHIPTSVEPHRTSTTSIPIRSSSRQRRLSARPFTVANISPSPTVVVYSIACYRQTVSVLAMTSFIRYALVALAIAQTVVAESTIGETIPVTINEGYSTQVVVPASSGTIKPITVLGNSSLPAGTPGFPHLVQGLLVVCGP